ncbi:MAG: site-2 protease family protein, partial [Burkholderiaceae bacterium]
MTALAFVFGVALLVTIHEYGHYRVARAMGVKVLRFSVGFGRPVWRKLGADGTEWVVGWIPLGGYVRMLDEGDGPVAPAEQAQAFNRQPLAAKAAIVAAGPLANALLAV